MSKNYSIKVTPLAVDMGGGFQAIIPQFGRGIVGYGDDQASAVGDLLSALPGFLDFLAETGQEAPEPEIPREVEEFSGKFNVRIPKVLHADLTDLAEENEVSLNQMVTMLLTSAAVQARSGRLASRSSEAQRSRRREVWDIQEEDRIIDIAQILVPERALQRWEQEA